MGRNRRARYGMKPRLFSVSQCRCLYALAHGVQPENAGWFCGRGRSTIYRWLADERFRATLDQLMRDRADQADALRFIISDPGTTAAAKLEAMRKLGNPETHHGFRDLEDRQSTTERNIVDFVMQSAVGASMKVG